MGEGHARPAGSAFAGLPEHRHQGLGAPAPLPGLPQGREVRRFNTKSDRAADGALQHLRRLAEDDLVLHGLLATHFSFKSVARRARSDESNTKTGQDGDYG